MLFLASGWELEGREVGLGSWSFSNASSKLTMLFRAVLVSFIKVCKLQNLKNRYVCLDAGSTVYSSSLTKISWRILVSCKISVRSREPNVLHSQKWPREIPDLPSQLGQVNLRAWHRMESHGQAALDGNTWQLWPQCWESLGGCHPGLMWVWAGWRSPRRNPVVRGCEKRSPSLELSAVGENGFQGSWGCREWTIWQ